MGWIVQAVATASVAFVATNIDDIIILMLFFAQVNAIRPNHIIAGQYLGFGALILASLPGFLGGSLVPKEWIGLLGILPIIIGISQFLSHDKPDTDVQTVACQVDAPATKRSILSKLATLLTPQTYSVAAVTFANGGDNIGIYVPLFASCDLPTLMMTLVVFFLLIGVWCYVAYRLTQFPAIARVLTRYGHAIVPFVLIGLGIFILLESKTYQLVTSTQLLPM